MVSDVPQSSLRRAVFSMAFWMLIASAAFADANDSATSTGITPTRTAAPLGLGDTLGLLREASIALGDAMTTPTAAASEVARARLMAADSYMRLIAEAVPTRVFCRWSVLGKQRVVAERTREREYKASGVVSGVTGVRFQASRGDVYLISMIVRDAAGGQQVFSLERWVSASLPRQEVFYFDRPQTIASIALTMRHDGKSSHRMAVSLGVPERPEYAREIAALCTDAAGEIRAGHWHEARAQVRDALRLLEAWRMEQSDASGKASPR